MGFQRDAEDPVGEDVALLNHLARVDGLDRVMVRTKGKVAPRAVEVSRAQRLAERAGVIGASSFKRL